MSVRFTDPDTSHEAAAMIAPVLRPEQARVFGLLRSALTAYEIATNLRWQGFPRDQSCVAKRLSELRDLGLVYDTGQRRPGRTGRPLIVWART